MVFTSNNKKAIIASGTEIPVPVSTLQSAVSSGINGIAQTSNIQFKKVALQLEVVPLINSEKEVSLDILQKIDSIAGSTILDGNAIPNIATRYIRTTVSAANGSTIVLGGLMTDSKQKNFNGVPILDRIPILGYLFRSTSDNKTRTELIILMRPEVTLTKLDLYRLRQTTKEKMALNKELDKHPPLNQGEYEEEYESSEKQLPPPDLPPIKEK
jgi:type II secretory pathway component GspD/PulD (secretin)